MVAASKIVWNGFVGFKMPTRIQTSLGLGSTTALGIRNPNWWLACLQAVQAEGDDGGTHLRPRHRQHWTWTHVIQHELIQSAVELLKGNMSQIEKLHDHLPWSHTTVAQPRFLHESCHAVQGTAVLSLNLFVVKHRYCGIPQSRICVLLWQKT